MALARQHVHLTGPTQLRLMGMLLVGLLPGQLLLLGRLPGQELLVQGRVLPGQLLQGRVPLV